MLDYLRIMINARVAKMDERGASAVEYGLLVAGIAALIVAVIFLFGQQIADVFSGTCNDIQQSGYGSGC
ncbi:MAG: Flp family type IVb pilin [Nocardioides sp.]